MSRYDELLENYLAELRKARARTLDWWERLIAREIAVAGSRTEAIKRLKMRWQVGPVAHPYIIAVYRKYFLLADAINKKAEAEEEETEEQWKPDDERAWGTDDDEDEEEDQEEGIVEPQYLLLENIRELDEELYEFMQPLVFSPIGVDSAGEYA